MTAAFSQTDDSETLETADTDDPLVVDVVAAGDGNGWWVAYSDGTLSASGSATEGLTLADDSDGLAGDVVAAVGTRDGRGLYVLDAAGWLHTAHPRPENWFPQPESWHPKPEAWEPVDAAVAPGDLVVWVLFTPIQGGEDGKLFRVTPDGADKYPNPEDWDWIPRPENWVPVAVSGF